MFETLKLIFFRIQPTGKVTDALLERLVRREFGDRSSEVKQKLQKVESETPNSRNRISASILKLSEKNFDAIDHLIEVANIDFRDVIASAEYPGCLKVGFDIPENRRKQIYLADWKQYSKWLRKV